ncbi:MAG: hypothetical protein E7526_01730 [Ruminococcaceae bacterium]|nr:hypothetical protein [Oscillospiraceae bacterium]
MIIDSIKQQKGHLFEIKLTGGKVVLLDKDYVLEKALKTGDDISAAELKNMVVESEYRRAVSRAVWYIERGSLSKKKLTEKLIAAGISRDACHKAVLRMEELDLINDVAFAERLAEQYLQGGISVREAENKMVLKGIDRKTAKEALDLFEVDAKKQIKLLISKKYRTKLQCAENVPKVFAALVRKGFNYSDIKSVLSEYSEQLKYSEE